MSTVLYENLYNGVYCELVLCEDKSMVVMCDGKKVSYYPPEVYKCAPNEQWLYEGFLELELDRDLLFDQEFLDLIEKMEEHNEKVLSEA